MNSNIDSWDACCLFCEEMPELIVQTALRQKYRLTCSTDSQSIAQTFFQVYDVSGKERKLYLEGEELEFWSEQEFLKGFNSYVEAARLMAQAKHIYRDH
jgi:hypothetical protein